MRDDFTQQTLDILAKRVGNRCSNPSCRKLTTGPRTDSSKVINIGVAAHITAASRKGPRFDQNLSSEERKSPDNGIWLCQNCAKLVDNDQARYTVEVLRKWKQCAETATLQEIEGVVNSSNVLETSVDIDISYKEIQTLSRRHDYLLEVKAINLGRDPIVNYHLDLEIPAQVLENPKKNSLYIPNRSSHDISFFRVASSSNNEPFFPGDEKIIVAIPYYVDQDIYLLDRTKLFDTLVRATFYRQNFQPLIVEKPFRELQCF